MTWLCRARCGFVRCDAATYCVTWLCRVRHGFVGRLPSPAQCHLRGFGAETLLSPEAREDLEKEGEEDERVAPFKRGLREHRGRGWETRGEGREEERVEIKGKGEGEGEVESQK